MQRPFIEEGAARPSSVPVSMALAVEQASTVESTLQPDEPGEVKYSFFDSKVLSAATFPLFFEQVERAELGEMHRYGGG